MRNGPVDHVGSVRSLFTKMVVHVCYPGDRSHIDWQDVCSREATTSHTAGTQYGPMTSIGERRADVKDVLQSLSRRLQIAAVGTVLAVATV